MRRPARAATACSPCRGRAATRCSTRSGCRTGRTTTCPSPRVDWQGMPVVVCRTGYTGERGYELVPRWEDAGALWDAVLAAGEPFGIRPCGLGARDTLRTEMGYPLHGQDLSLDITPVQARCGWAVGWKKPAFWGRDALLAEKEAGAAPAAVGARGPGARHPAAAHGGVDGGRRAGRRGHQRHVLADPRRSGIALALLDRGGGRGRRGGRRRPRPAGPVPRRQAAVRHAVDAARHDAPRRSCWSG